MKVKRRIKKFQCRKFESSFQGQVEFYLSLKQLCDVIKFVLKSERMDIIDS